MKDVLRAIDRGETVTVLYRGKEKAKLVPSSLASRTEGSSAKVEDQPFFGMWSDCKDLADPASYLRNLREPRNVVTEPGKRRPV